MEDILSKDHGAYIKQYVKGNMPYPQNNRPKVDITNELDADGIIIYQKFIGTFIWVIELGHIGINTGLSCILQKHSSQEGHLDNVYNIFRYLKVNLKDNPERVIFGVTLGQ